MIPQYMPCRHPETVISSKCLTLIATIWGGEQPADFHAYYLEYLVFHMPPKKLESSLRWLIQRGLTRKLFRDYIVTQCGGSALEFFRHVTMGIEKDWELRAISAKDMQ